MGRRAICMEGVISAMRADGYYAHAFQVYTERTGLLSERSFDALLRGCIRTDWVLDTFIRDVWNHTLKIHRKYQEKARQLEAITEEELQQPVFPFPGLESVTRAWCLRVMQEACEKNIPT